MTTPCNQPTNPTSGGEGEEKIWTVDRDPDGSYTIRNEKGEVRGRYKNADFAVVALAMILGECRYKVQPPSPAPPPATDQELAEIVKRCDRATAGPWLHFEANEIYRNGDRLVWGCRGEGHGTVAEAADYQKEAEANARFIAHARTDIPLLLSRLATAERENDVLADLYKTAHSERDSALAALAEMRTEIRRAKAIAEGAEGWEDVPLDCPMLFAVAALRREREAAAPSAIAEQPKEGAQ